MNEQLSADSSDFARRTHHEHTEDPTYDADTDNANNTHLNGNPKQLVTPTIVSSDSINLRSQSPDATASTDSGQCPLNGDSALTTPAVVSSDSLNFRSHSLDATASTDSGLTSQYPITSSSDSQCASISSSQTSASTRYQERPPQSRVQHTAYSQDSTHVSIYVTNLPFIVRWQELKDLVKEIVPANLIVRAEVYTADSNNKKSQGVGSITLRGRDTALKCIEYLDGYEWYQCILSATLLPPTFVPFAPAQPLTYPPVVFPARPAMLSTPGATPLNQFAVPMMGMQMQPPFLTEFPPPTTASSPSVSGSDYMPQSHFHHQPPLRQRQDLRKVFIGNIPFTTEWQDLKDFVQTAGAVARVDIINNSEGLSRGFAIAVFDSDEDAAHAIQLFDGIEFQGRVLTVRLDRFPESRPNFAPAQFGSVGGSSLKSNSYKKAGRKDNYYYIPSNYPHFGDRQPEYGPPYDSSGVFWSSNMSQSLSNMQAQFQNMQIMPQLPFRFDQTGVQQFPPHMQAQMQAQAQPQPQTAQSSQYQMMMPVIPPLQMQQAMTGRHAPTATSGSTPPQQ